MTRTDHAPPEIRIVGLGGSLAERSTSRAALDTALQGAEAAEHDPATTRLFDVREMSLPMYDPGAEAAPEAAEALAVGREKVFCPTSGRRSCAAPPNASARSRPRRKPCSTTWAACSKGGPATRRPEHAENVFRRFRATLK